MFTWSNTKVSSWDLSLKWVNHEILGLQMRKVNLSLNFEVRKIVLFFNLYCLTEELERCLCPLCGCRSLVILEATATFYTRSSWPCLLSQHARSCHLLGTTGSCGPHCQKSGFSRLTGPRYPLLTSPIEERLCPRILLPKDFGLVSLCLKPLGIGQLPFLQRTNLFIREQDGIGMSL